MINLLFICVIHAIAAPDFWANTTALRQSLTELRTARRDVAEELAIKLCRSGDTRSIMLIICCLNRLDTLKQLSRHDDYISPGIYYPLHLFSCTVIDAIARSHSPYREDFLFVLHSGPYCRMKASQRLTRQHQDLSEKGILLAFRHLKEPSPKVITFLKNYHLNNPHGLDGEVVVKPWESRLWGIINLALVEMQSHQAAELLAERLHAYFRDQVLPRGSLPARDRVLEAVGYFLQEHRDKNQSILVMERILTKSKNDDQTVFKLINRYCKPLCLSHSDVIGEFGTAPRWIGMELPLLIEHFRLLYRSGQSSPKLLSDPVYLLALFEISKLIVTRLVYPVLVTKVVAMLDSRQYSRRQAGTALLRIMHLVDSTGCRKYLKSMHVTPEVERRLSEILKVDFFRQ